MNKPIIIAIEESESTLVSAVNQILSSGVPPYFAEKVFSKVHEELKKMAREQLENEQKRYMDSLQNQDKGAENAPLEENNAK